MIQEIKSDSLSVSVSLNGAELRSVKGRDGCEYLWQGDAATWVDRSPVLFPYVARLTDGRYSLDGEIYNMQIHGFASSSVFKLVEKSESRVVLELQDSAETIQQYPRRFSFRVTYSLAGNRLDVLFSVINNDSRSLYFGLGGHPGFNVPLEAGLNFEDYRLRFAESCEAKILEFTPDCFPTGNSKPFPLEDGRILNLQHSLFDDDAIVLKDCCRQITLESTKGKRSISLEYPDMPYLGIWHWPRTSTPYVCIEPWLSLPSKAGELTVFEEKSDLVCLKAGEVYENKWSIIINE